MTKNNDLRVWWIPQIPMPPFHAPVTDVEQALVVLNVLGRYDMFQLQHNIKPDYSNAGGLEIYRNGDWEEWENEDGDTINEIRRERAL